MSLYNDAAKCIESRQGCLIFDVRRVEEYLEITDGGREEEGAMFPLSGISPYFRGKSKKKVRF